MGQGCTFPTAIAVNINAGYRVLLSIDGPGRARERRSHANQLLSHRGRGGPFGWPPAKRCRQELRDGGKLADSRKSAERFGHAVVADVESNLGDLRFRIEENPARQNLEGEAPECVHIGFRWRKIVGRAERPPDLRSTVGTRSTSRANVASGEPEIDQHGLDASTQDHVRRLDIQMSDADFMHGLETS